MLLLACARLHAIPLEKDAGAAAPAATGTQDDAEITVTNLTGVFDPRQVEPQTAESWRRLHNHSPTNGAGQWAAETNQPFRVIGGYSERFNNMDVDAIASETASNEVLLRMQAERIPIDPHAIQRDLNATATNDDSEEKRMRALIKSVAAQPSNRSENEIKGLRVALTYLIMAGLIILIIFARR